MSSHLCYVADKAHMKAQLEEVALENDTAVQISAPDEMLHATIKETAPAAVVFDHDVDNLSSIIEGVRTDPKMPSMPLIVCVPEPEPDFLGQAFNWGFDDYLVFDARDKLSVLVAAIQKRDSWNVMRAPLGKVMVAHPDRLERIKLARVLKRNGFDAVFSSTADETLSVLRERQVRVAVCSCDLPGMQLDGFFNDIAAVGASIPWAILATNDQADVVRPQIPSDMMVKMFEALGDAEGIAYAVNELIAPSAARQRRSERVLYGTPITFSQQDSNLVIDGFTFNINLGGLYIRSLTSLPLQSKIQLAFRPPHGRGQLIVDAQVVWRKQFGDTHVASPPGMGVQFLDMWEADRAAYETGYQLLLEKMICNTSTPEPFAPSSDSSRSP